MTDTPAPPPASVLAAAREAVELEKRCRDFRETSASGFLTRLEADVREECRAHAGTHYGAIAAALLAAHEREADLGAQIEAAVERVLDRRASAMMDLTWFPPLPNNETHHHTQPGDTP